MAASNGGWKLLLAVATVTLLSIVCNAAAVQTSSTAGGREQATEMHTSRAHKNIVHAYANHLGQQQHQRPLQQQYYDSQSNHNGIATPTTADSAAENSDRRSYNGYSASGSSGDWLGAYNGGNSGGSSSYNFGTAKLNGLTNLSGLRHISSGFDGSAGGPIAAALVQEQKPIYEQQQGNDYGASGAAGHTGSTAYSATQSNDKISDGNFLHRFEHSSGGYDELSGASTYAHQQYFTPHDSHSGSDSGSSSASGGDAEVPFSHHHGGDGGGGGEADEGDDSANYASEHQHSEGGHSPSHVINYIPYPVVKKVHVPVREPVEIPISHAVIVPVHKPVPIHVPVTKSVAVPVEKELRVPVERVVPYPVEKPVPVPVEKRVPFEVVKYVPVKVPHPFPVKVPVFKTILHKVKKGGSW